MLMLFFLFSCCGAATCTVASCDDFMKDIAFAFSCDSDSSCHDQIATQLQLIVPADSESVFASGSAEILELVKSTRCFNSTACEQSLEVRDKLDKWARIPTSSVLAIQRREDFKVRRRVLKNTTCDTPYDEASTLAWDRRCEFLLPFSVFEQVAANRR
jgi:hypothetical protein